jgi:hypothetical protein
MLNLSDKELDRFSQEAAQEYEPGDVLGPRSWERLEARVTQEFGPPGWNPIRHIRRFPFYYAPALLLLLGVGYYFLRPGVSSGSSPGATVKDPAEKASIQNQNSVSNKATSTRDSSTTDFHGSDAATASGAAGATADGKASAGTAPGAKAGGEAASGAAAVRSAASSGATAGGTAAVGSAASGVKSAAADRKVSRGTGSDATANGAGLTVAGSKSGSGRRGSRGIGSDRRTGSRSGSGRLNDSKGADKADDNTIAVTTPLNSGANGTQGLTKAERELSLSYVQRPRPLGKRGPISDSALRAFNAKTGVPAPIKRKGVYVINRKWQFGLKIAPDFTSVNSLAGDKAGSSFGLTVDYNFAPHWYLGSGILATRRNYAARSQDYHAPPKFFQQNNIYGNVTFVKGSFYMMEIPLNLRYDFSIAGNTFFFISAGTSSYLMTTENANLYWRHFNMDECNSTDHLPIHRTNLFSTVNLSAGVEAGLSNSMSLLIAPYMKLPTRSLGLGQVQMNSVGIDFILKWSPVTGRGRR